MNKSTATGLKSSVTRILLAAAVVLSIWTSGATAQETLGDLMQESGCNYLIGKWAGETSEGQKYEIEYKWALKNHVISVHFKGFDIEYHGIIFFKPNEQEVVQIGVDNNGGTGKGTWFAEYGKATMRNEQQGEYGEVSRMGFVYTWTDSQTMKMELYNLDEYGQLSGQPDDTLEYKRQKKQATKKTRATK
ncbi:MAG: hypothetical protein U9Q07_05345 [Planctomycetota bacterium]|nr:hypothetical protein [Planctomycetota bacterium]